MKISDHIMRGENEQLSSLVAKEVGTCHTIHFTLSWNCVSGAAA